MALPMLEPAPVVTEHTPVFRDRFDNPGLCRHCQHYLTGLMVLPHKSLAHRACGILESPDTTNLSRLLSEAPWRADAINGRRRRCRRHPTLPHRRRRRESLLALDDTRREHVGRLFDHVDRHDHPREGTS